MAPAVHTEPTGDVNKTWAFAMVGFVLLSAAVGFFSALPNIAAVILFRGSDFLSIIDEPQRDAVTAGTVAYPVFV